MEDFTPYHRSFSVGGRLVQPDLNRITGPAGPTQVEPRVMQVLLALVDQPGTVVPRRRLLDAVWTDQIVGEENLTRAISELRRILGDDSREPSLIETIRNHGYRLIAEIQSVPDELPPEGHDEADGEVSGVEIGGPGRRWPWLRWGPLLVVLGVGLWWVFPHHPQGPGTTFTLWPGSPVPLTSYPGEERHPALSPDGTRVAFVWGGGDLPAGCASAIFIKQRNLESPVRLTSAPGWVAWPSWSPDGQTLAFVQGGNRDIALCTIASLGGVVREVFHSPDLIEGVDWLPDGRRLVFSALGAGHRARKLMVLDLDSLTTRFVPGSDVLTGEDFHPSCRPAADGLAWMHRDPAGDWTLRTGDLENPESQVLAQDMGTLGRVAWLPDGRHLVFAATGSEVSRFWTLAMGVSVPRMLDTGPGSAQNPAVSRLSGDLAYEQVRLDRNLILMRVKDRNPWQLTSEPLAPSTRGEYGADFSPDGQRIALVSTRTGYPEIWLADRQGDDLVQLTDFKAKDLGSLRWSPGGDKIAFQINRGSRAEIRVLAAEGGVPVAVSTGPQEAILSGWMPDGGALIVAQKSRGRWQLLAVGIPDSPTSSKGQSHPITDAPATSGAISTDGRFLFFTRPDQEGLWRQGINGGLPEIAIADLLPSDRSNWRLQGDHIAWVERIAGIPYLVWQDQNTGAASLVADVTGLAAGGLAVSPGGDAFIYARETVAAADLMLMTTESNP